jgi:N-acetylmuramoyl-L-alanine amidase CwlA
VYLDTLSAVSVAELSSPGLTLGTLTHALLQKKNKKTKNNQSIYAGGQHQSNKKTSKSRTKATLPEQTKARGIVWYQYGTY